MIQKNVVKLRSVSTTICIQLLLKILSELDPENNR